MIRDSIVISGSAEVILSIAFSAAGLAKPSIISALTASSLRAEEAPPEYRAGFDVAVSRAVARMNVLCEMCLPFVKRNGLFIAMKGPDCEEELSEAKHAIAELGAKTEKVVKYTVPGTDIVHSAILVRKTGETPKKYPRRWAQIKKQPL